MESQRGPLSRGDLVERDITLLKPHARNARTHSKKQIGQIARSIRKFGFTNPILIDEEDRIIAGHGRVEAAKSLGMTRVPVLLLEGMSEADRKAYVIADNRLAELAGTVNCSAWSWAICRRLCRTSTLTSSALRWRK